jgi:hypothetical protein
VMDTKLGIQIAYDAWQLTLIPKINLTPGRYMNAPIVSDGTFSRSVVDTPLADVSPCEVCALGALFVAQLTKRDKSDLPFLVHGSALDRKDILFALPFAKEDLDTIETLFEGQHMYCTGLDREQADELVSSAEDINEAWTRQELARGLFLNLIENEGSLKLNRKKPFLGLSREETLTSAARAALSKHDISFPQPIAPALRRVPMREKTKLRIQVAYDAWQLTLSDRLRLEKGYYLTPPKGRHLGSFLAEWRVGEGEPCQVCALGTLFLARLQTLPKARSLPGGLGRFNAVQDLPFEPKDLTTIETLFENEWIPISGVSSTLAKEALDKYSDIQVLGLNERARALFLNLIENEGVLKLNAKLPLAGLDASPELSEAALRVLDKHGIPLHTSPLEIR